MSSYQNSIPVTIHAEIDNDIIIAEESSSQRGGGVTTGRRIFRSVFGSAFGIGCCCCGALLLMAYLGGSPIDSNHVSSLSVNNNMEELAQQQILPVDMLEETPVHHRAPVHHRKDDDDKDDAEDDVEDDEPADEPVDEPEDEPAPVHKHHNHTHAEADENENGIPDKKENEFWATIEKDIHDFFHHPATTETAAIEAAAFENEFGYD